MPDHGQLYQQVVEQCREQRNLEWEKLQVLAGDDLPSGQFEEVEQVAVREPVARRLRAHHAGTGGNSQRTQPERVDRREMQSRARVGGAMKVLQCRLDIGQIAGQAVEDEVIERLRDRIALDVGGEKFQRRIAAVARAGLVNHARTEIESEPSPGLQARQQVARPAAPFEHPAALGNMVSEIPQHLGVVSPLQPARAVVMPSHPVKVVTHGQLGGVFRHGIRAASSQRPLRQEFKAKLPVSCEASGFCGTPSGQIPLRSSALVREGGQAAHAGLHLEKTPGQRLRGQLLIGQTRAGRRQVKCAKVQPAERAGGDAGDG